SRELWLATEHRKARPTQSTASNRVRWLCRQLATTIYTFLGALIVAGFFTFVPKRFMHSACLAGSRFAPAKRKHKTLKYLRKTRARNGVCGWRASLNRLYELGAF